MSTRESFTITRDKLREALDAALPSHAAYGPVFEKLCEELGIEYEAPTEPTARTRSTKKASKKSAKKMAHKTTPAD